MSRPPRRWLTAEQEAELRDFVLHEQPTTQEVINAVAAEWGIRYSATGMRNALLRVGAYLPHGRARGTQQRWTIDPPPKRRKGS
jgi:transposase